jgi:hypothetical protein
MHAIPAGLVRWVLEIQAARRQVVRMDIDDHRAPRI